MKEYIKAHWCYMDNFGDAINPYLLSKLSGKRVVYRNYNKPDYWIEFKMLMRCFLNNKHYDFNRLKPYNPNEKVLLCVGSILSRCRKNFIVWGAGYMSWKEKTIEKGTVYAVRGKYSAQKLYGNNISDKLVFSDPAILLPLVYHPTIKKSFNIGVIPHNLDYTLVNEKYSINSQINIIDLHTSDVEHVVDEIIKCNIILSSSLHGVIVAHAYGIPALWIKLGDISTDGIKFYDYFDSVNIKEYNGNEFNLEHMLRIDYRNYPENVKTLMFPTIDLALMQKKLLKVAPFRLLPQYSEWANS